MTRVRIVEVLYLTLRTVWYVLGPEVDLDSVLKCIAIISMWLHHHNHPTKVVRTSLSSSYRHRHTQVQQHHQSECGAMNPWPLLWMTWHIRYWRLCLRRFSVCQQPQHPSSAFQSWEKDIAPTLRTCDGSQWHSFLCYFVLIACYIV